VPEQPVQSALLFSICFDTPFFFDVSKLHILSQTERPLSAGPENSQNSEMIAYHIYRQAQGSLSNLVPTLFLPLQDVRTRRPLVTLFDARYSKE
jgi:hypothetical protein